MHRNRRERWTTAAEILRSAEWETAIGGEGRARAVTARYKLEDGDVLMLCGERLVEALGAERIADILTDRRDPEESCRRLVDAALEGRSAENATVILAQYRIPSPRPR